MGLFSGPISTNLDQFIRIILAGDDSGVQFTGQPGQELNNVIIGDKRYGSELVVGRGDSYPVDTAYHCTIANTSGLTITSAADVTSTLQSDTGSTTGLFNGTTSGNYILLGSDYPFDGLKAKVNTLGTIESANVTYEFLRNLSPTWVAVDWMATDADFPYNQRANNIATISGISEQWRTGFDPEAATPAAWDQVTLNINGQDITKYWTRFRITSAITSDAVIEQLKQHTNRAEINAEGTLEFFGYARYPGLFFASLSGNANRNPANENVPISTNMTEIRNDNQFNNNASDGIIIRGNLSPGIDTSIPSLVIVEWYPNTNNAGDVELRLDLVIAGEGFVFDGTAPAVSSTPVVTSVPINSINKKFTTILQASAKDAIPTELFYGDLYRDATGGNPNDTLAGTITISDIRVSSHRWKS